MRISQIRSWQADFATQVTWNAESTRVYIPGPDHVVVYDVTQSRHEQISIDEYNRQNPFQNTAGIPDKGGCSDLGKHKYAVSPGKTMLATGWSDAQRGSLKTVIDLWDLTAKKCLFQFPGYDGSLSALTFSPDGNYLVFSTDRVTYVWHIKKAEFTCKIKYAVSAAFVPGEDTLAVTDIRAWLGYRNGLWDVKKCELMQKYANGGLNSAFSPNGDLFAANDGGQVLILDAKTGELLLELAGHPDFVHVLSFSPDGRYILSGSYGGQDAMSIYILWAVKH